jgi:hypothetical protein
MKALKIVGLVIVSLIGILILVGLLSWALFSQKVAKSYEVNSPTLPTKILIATQGSSFKEALVTSLSEQLRTPPVYIKVVDVSALPTINEAEWRVIVIVNTCEGGEMQADVSNYLARAKALPKLVLLITSGSGTWQPTGLSIDSISSASRKQRIQPLVADIALRVQKILEVVP